MKKIYIVLFLCSFFISNGQLRKEKYLDVLDKINNSNDFIEFSSDLEIKKVSFKVDEYLNHFCIYSNLFQSLNLNSENKKYCSSNDWIYVDLKKDKNLEKISEEGINNLIIRFSYKIQEYIIVTVEPNSLSNEVLIYLFDVSNCEVQLVESKKVFSE